MKIEIINARKEDLPVVRNLVRFYVYDMSGPMGWKCPENGRFDGCDELPKYWEEENRHPFMLRCEGELAGFALVNRRREDPEIDYSMGEFFVVRKFRRKGAGRFVAADLFNRFQGRWEVEQLVKNTPAVAFWREVVGEYSGGEYSETVRPGDGWGEMNLLRFDSR